jgi:hypothetical protein
MDLMMIWMKDRASQAFATQQVLHEIDALSHSPMTRARCSFDDRMSASTIPGVAQARASACT